MEIKDAIYGRRSVRKFLSKPVPREKLESVLKAGTYAPSAMNDQQRQFIAVTDRGALERLNEAVERAADDDTRARIKGRSESGEFSFFYCAPALILVCDSGTAPRPAEDCACALENMFLAALDEGLGSCWINQLTDLSVRPEVREVLIELGMRENCKVYGCCALGYSAAEPVLLKPKTNEIIIL